MHRRNKEYNTNKKGYRGFRAFEEEEMGWFDYQLEALLDLMFSRKTGLEKKLEVEYDGTI